MDEPKLPPVLKHRRGTPSEWDSTQVGDIIRCRSLPSIVYEIVADDEQYRMWGLRSIPDRRPSLLSKKRDRDYEKIGEADC